MSDGICNSSLADFLVVSSLSDVYDCAWGGIIHLHWSHGLICVHNFCDVL